MEFTHDFAVAHSKITGRTLVSGDRCFDLWQLLEQALKVPGDVIEVGVWRGGTGYLLCERVQQLKANREVFLCDTFTGVVKAGPRDNQYVGGEHADADATDVARFLEDHGIIDWRFIPGIFPEDANETLFDGFCFAHIDVDVYQSAKDAFAFIWSRMPPGGIIVLDDYLWPACGGITAFIDETRQLLGNVFVHTVPYHGVFIKTAT